MINYTNPDRERFVNIAAMALFNVPANEEVTVVDIIDKLRSHYQIIVAVPIDLVKSTYSVEEESTIISFDVRKV